MPLMPLAAPSVAQPRPISCLGRCGRPARFRQSAAPAAHTRGSSGERARSRRWWWRLRSRGRPSVLPPWRTTAAVPRRQIAPRVEGASAHTSASISLSASASSGSPPRQVSGAASRSRVPHSSRKRRTWCIRTLSTWTWTWTQCTSSLGAPIPSAARAPRDLLDVVGKGVAYWRTLTCDSKQAEYMAVRSPVALRSCDERRNAASG